MHRALTLAGRGIALTAPNPAAGGAPSAPSTFPKNGPSLPRELQNLIPGSSENPQETYTTRVEQPPGISPRDPHGTVLEPLDAHGSLDTHLTY
jgi:hypothetical protein